MKTQCSQNRERNLSVAVAWFSLLFLVIAGPLHLFGAQDQPKVGQDRFPPRLKTFFADKEKEARFLAEQLHLEVSPDIWRYYEAASREDWNAVGDWWRALTRRNSRNIKDSKQEPALQTPIWFTIIETGSAYEQFENGGTKYFVACANDIIKSIPPGSIYFGGTDQGFALVAAFSKSHQRADPFFTLTQNALPSDNYLTYLRATYGERIYIPTVEDSRAALQQSTEDARTRLEHDRKFPNEPKQVRPGEDISIVDGKVQVAGQMGVIALKGLLSKLIFDKNPDRQFYVDEGFPLEWMYPFLSPNGLILKINRTPLPELSEAEVRKDLAFWSQYIQPMIGDWLREETSIKTLCDFVQKVYVEQDFTSFKADPEFVTNDAANKAFSKLRSSIAGVYAWRLMQAKGPVEKQRMSDAADFAFRQAFALCPRSPEAVFRFINLLVQQGRIDDALLIARTASHCAPANTQMGNLIQELQRIKERQK
jgi:hypothetical protein